MHEGEATVLSGGLCVVMHGPRQSHFIFIFFFNDPATTKIYTLSLRDGSSELFGRMRNLSRPGAPGSPSSPAETDLPWEPGP